MHRHFRTLSYFLVYGASYGLILGAVAGSLIFPILGSILSAPWGLVMGGILGIIAGVVIIIYNTLFLNFDTDLVSYRRCLTIGIGIITVVGSVIFMAITLYAFFIPDELNANFDANLYALMFIGAAFWGGLASAYSASRYADWYIDLIIKRKNDFPEPLPIHLEIASAFLKEYRSHLWQFVAVTAILNSFIHHISHDRITSLNFNYLYVIFHLPSGVIFSSIYALLSGIANAFLLAYMMRILYQEYATTLTRTLYRRSIVITTILTTFSGGILLMLGGIFFIFRGYPFYPNYSEGWGQSYNIHAVTLLYLLVVLLFAAFAAHTTYRVARQYENVVFTDDVGKAKTKQQKANI